MMHGPITVRSYFTLPNKNEDLNELLDFLSNFPLLTTAIINFLLSLSCKVNCNTFQHRKTPTIATHYFVISLSLSSQISCKF